MRKTRMGGRGSIHCCSDAAIERSMSASAQLRKPLPCAFPRIVSASQSRTGTENPVLRRPRTAGGSGTWGMRANSFLPTGFFKLRNRCELFECLEVQRSIHGIFVLPRHKKAATEQIAAAVTRTVLKEAG